jgi:hypothetical protein
MAVGAEAPSLLSGLIFDSDGARLACSRRASVIDTMSRRRLSLAVAPSIPRPAHSGGRHRRGVLDRLRALFASGAEVSDSVAPLGLDAATQRAVLDRSATLAERWTKLASLELRELVRSLRRRLHEREHNRQRVEETRKRARQKADSRETRVRWPSAASECLTIFPKASRWDSLGMIDGRLPPVRIEALFV